MSYVLPASKVHQEFEAIAANGGNLLNACIIAPHFGLHRYSIENEQAHLGDYDAENGSVFSFYPDKTAGSTVKSDEVRLFAPQASLRYHTDALAGGSSDGLLSDGGNRIHSADLIFKTANGYTRSSAFGTRDVKVGDPVKVTWGSGEELKSFIAGLAHDIDAATVGSVNVVTDYDQSESGTVTDVTLADGSAAYSFSADASGYDGLQNGVLNETYQCVVTSTDGTLANTIVNVTSASGTDDESGRALVDGGATTIGGNGAKITVTETTSGFTVGDSFKVNIKQAYTEVAPTSSGVYTGSNDTRYIIKITTGGVVGTDSPAFTVTTSDGTDSLPAQTISAAGPYALGSHGTIVTFTDTAPLLKGAEYYVDVTAEQAGAYKIIIIADKLATASTTTALSVEFNLKADIELEPAQFSANDTRITVAADATDRNSILGTDTTMDIMEADLYVDYRELLTEFNEVFTGVLTPEEALTVCGPAVNANPLGLMVSKATENSGGTMVYFTTVAEDTDDAYVDAIAFLSTSDLPYGLVAYSNSDAVREALKAQAMSLSTPEMGQWRGYYWAIDEPLVKAVSDKLDNGSDILCTVGIDGDGDFTKVSADGAKFLSDGVAAGDTFRINYATSPEGKVTYDEYQIDSVDSEVDLTLLTGLPSAISVGHKMEVWHTTTRTELITDVKAVAAESDYRRGVLVWSEPLSDGQNENISVSVMAAAIAGLRSGVAPHQPLTNVSVSGFKMGSYWSLRRAEMDDMASGGVWIVTQTLEGAVYNRHQVTTDMSDINHREQTITTNFDHISRDVRDAMSPYYGRGNVSDTMLDLIYHAFVNVTTMIMARPYPDTIGAQLFSMDISELKVDPVLRDHIILKGHPVMPYPLNNEDIYLIVS